MAVAFGAVPYVIKAYNLALGIFILFADCAAFLFMSHVIAMRRK